MTFNDSQVPNPLEPVEDSHQETESSQPLESQPSSVESGAAPDAAGPDESFVKKVTGSLKRGTGALRARMKVRDDYVTELRQTLASEEEAAPARKSGGLLRRLTGSLRRVTGPLRGQTGELQHEAPVEQAPEHQVIEEQAPAPFVPGPDIEDRFMSDRLGEPASDELELEVFPAVEEEVFDTPLLPDESLEEVEEEVQLFRDQPFPLSHEEEALKSEQEPAGEDSDWVSEIRQEAAASQETGVPGEAQPAVPPSTETAPPARGSGGLRSFIMGIFSGGARHKAEGKEEISDEIVTGRLGRSLGAEPEQPVAPESTSLDDLYAQDPSQPVHGAAALGEDYVDELEAPFADVTDAASTAAPLFAEGEFVEEAAAEEEDALFPDELASRLGSLTGEPGTAPAAQEFSPEITPEDEALIWGEAAPASEEDVSAEYTFSPEDLWADTETLEEPEDRRGSGVPIDDLYAQQYLTGELTMPGQPGGTSQDNLLREALEQQPEGEAPAGDSSMSDLRAIALEDYDQSAVDRLAAAPAYTGPAVHGGAAFDEAYQETSAQAGRAARARTPLEKYLRALLVVLSVLVLAVAAFFVYMLTRGPVYQVGYIVPRPLPANLPYPTGVVLPGGWRFTLNKSTFVEGQWKPAGGEWLEGTELRRVVTLPWNPQTEAVVRTFKPGDKVLLDLSNNDTVDYTVTQVTRISQDDTQILSDRRPSLVIVLYQEKAPERWVVFCKP